MDIRRIIPNILSGKIEESLKFYGEFLGLKKVMDLQTVITMASPSNPTAQLNLVAYNRPHETNSLITITIEVADVDVMYEKAKERGYEIVYPLTIEPWGPVKRFWVKDPNGVIINIMSHTS